MYFESFIVLRIRQKDYIKVFPTFFRDLIAVRHCLLKIPHLYNLGRLKTFIARVRSNTGSPCIQWIFGREESPLWTETLLARNVGNFPTQLFWVFFSKSDFEMTKCVLFHSKTSKTRTFYTMGLTIVTRLI